MISLLHVLQLLLLTVVFVSGCFITNCPPGGKRSVTEEKAHQCEQCGPPGLGGRCYGPQICCSPQFGCMIGGSITSACQQETRSPSLCHNQAATCDGSAETGPVNGQCGALGICCTPETCTVDDDCTSSTLAVSDIAKGHRFHSKPIMLQHFDEPENVVPLIHSPADTWLYRRLIHSKANRLMNTVDGKSSAEPEVGPQGPPFIPLGPSRLADYF